eukprot:TRINITY_DN6025_c0_g1_i3.p1 TRINITY_DN6025_c0_g1~~TRINITY_DN6025_c0_g1_i3.p1  ORF type:complete len:2109 (+),score=495.25 TRINITY_DN6025_c0_g1_i3:208-6534(+)
MASAAAEAPASRESPRRTDAAARMATWKASPSRGTARSMSKASRAKHRKTHKFKSMLIDLPPDDAELHAAPPVYVSEDTVPWLDGDDRGLVTESSDEEWPNDDEEEEDDDMLSSLDGEQSKDVTPSAAITKGPSRRGSVTVVPALQSKQQEAKEETRAPSKPLDPRTPSKQGRSPRQLEIGTPSKSKLEPTAQSKQLGSETETNRTDFWSTAGTLAGAIRFSEAGRKPTLSRGAPATSASRRGSFLEMAMAASPRSLGLPGRRRSIEGASQGLRRTSMIAPETEDLDDWLQGEGLPGRQPSRGNTPQTSPRQRATHPCARRVKAIFKALRDGTLHELDEESLQVLLRVLHGNVHLKKLGYDFLRALAKETTLCEMDAGDVSVDSEGLHRDVYLFLDGYVEKRGNGSEPTDELTFGEVVASPSVLRWWLQGGNLEDGDDEDEGQDREFSETSLRVFEESAFLVIPRELFVQHLEPKVSSARLLKEAVEALEDEDGPLSVATISAFLRRLPAFEALPASVIDAMAERARLRQCGPMEVLSLPSSSPEQIMITVNSAVSAWSPTQEPADFYAASRSLRCTMRAARHEDRNQSLGDFVDKYRALELVEKTRPGELVKFSELALLFDAYPCGMVLITHRRTQIITLDKQSYMQYVMPHRAKDLLVEAADLFGRLPLRCRLNGVSHCWIKETALSSSSLLRCLPTSLQRQVLCKARIVDKKQDEWLFRNSTEAHSLCLVLSGALGLFRSEQQPVRPPGRALSRGHTLVAAAAEAAALQRRRTKEATSESSQTPEPEARRPTARLQSDGVGHRDVRKTSGKMWKEAARLSAIGGRRRGTALAAPKFAIEPFHTALPGQLVHAQDFKGLQEVEKIMEDKHIEGSRASSQMPWRRPSCLLAEQTWTGERNVSVGGSVLSEEFGARAMQDTRLLVLSLDDICEAVQNYIADTADSDLTGDEQERLLSDVTVILRSNVAGDSQGGEGLSRGQLDVLDKLLKNYDCFKILDPGDRYDLWQSAYSVSLWPGELACVPSAPPVTARAIQEDSSVSIGMEGKSRCCIVLQGELGAFSVLSKDDLVEQRLLYTVPPAAFAGELPQMEDDKPPKSGRALAELTVGLADRDAFLRAQQAPVIRALEKSTVLCLDTVRYLRLLARKMRGRAERDDVIRTIRYVHPEDRNDSQVAAADKLACSNAIWAQLEPEVRLLACRGMGWTRYERQEVVCWKGDEADKAYLLLKGSVSVWLTKDPESEDVDVHEEALKYANQSKEELQHKTRNLEAELQAAKNRRRQQHLKKLEKEQRRATKETKESSLERKASKGGRERRSVGAVSTTSSQDAELPERWVDGGSGAPKFRNGAVTTLVRVLEAGSCFGEQGILNDARRNATIIALEQCDMGIIEKEQFNKVLRKAFWQQMQTRARFVQQSLEPLLRLPDQRAGNSDKLHDSPRKSDTPSQKITFENYQVLAGFFSKSNCLQGSVLTTAGKPTKHLTIIKQGRVRLLGRTQPGKPALILGEIGSGQLLGAASTALGLAVEPYGAVCVSDDGVELLHMDAVDVHVRLPQAVLDGVKALETERQERFEARQKVLAGFQKEAFPPASGPQSAHATGCKRWFDSPFLRHQPHMLAATMPWLGLMRKKFKDYERDEQDELARVARNLHLDVGDVGKKVQAVEDEEPALLKYLREHENEPLSPRPKSGAVRSAAKAAKLARSRSRSGSPDAAGNRRPLSPRRPASARPASGGGGRPKSAGSGVWPPVWMRPPYAPWVEQHLPLHVPIHVRACGVQDNKLEATALYTTLDLDLQDDAPHTTRRPTMAPKPVEPEEPEHLEPHRRRPGTRLPTHVTLAESTVCSVTGSITCSAAVGRINSSESEYHVTPSPSPWARHVSGAGACSVAGVSATMLDDSPTGGFSSEEAEGLLRAVEPEPDKEHAVPGAALAEGALEALKATAAGTKPRRGEDMEDMQKETRRLSPRRTKSILDEPLQKDKEVGRGLPGALRCHIVAPAGFAVSAAMGGALSSAAGPKPCTARRAVSSTAPKAASKQLASGGCRLPDAYSQFFGHLKKDKPSLHDRQKHKELSRTVEKHACAMAKRRLLPDEDSILRKFEKSEIKNIKRVTGRW